MKLRETISLQGKKETITLTYLKMNLGDVMLQVQMGKTFYITGNGKIIAVIQKFLINKGK